MTFAAERLFLPLREIGLSGLLDLGIMFVLVYAVLVWVKETRAGFVLTGISIIGVVVVQAWQVFARYVPAGESQAGS